jgi:TolB-like protein/DNA-binding winged helix-turn-helix (wHTH) protein
MPESNPELRNARKSETLQIGAWRVNPALGEMTRDGEQSAETVRPDERAMRLLLCLAEHAGEIVAIDELLNQVWPGINVSQDSVYQAVTSLRRVLGDDAKSPVYIATIPRLGYKMVATVTRNSEQVQDGSPGSPPMKAITSSTSARWSPSRVAWTVAAAVALCGVVAFVLLFARRSGFNQNPAVTASSPPSQRSVAVLPFLDLTEGMRDEEFADGMTEELIDKLSNVPGVRVPSATASFYYKGKQVPVVEIARGLKVKYLLDGSVRKSSGQVRIAARLVRADNSYVIWSSTYDRPLSDLIMVQDNIAGEVVKALKSTVISQPPGQSD